MDGYMLYISFFFCVSFPLLCIFKKTTHAQHCPFCLPLALSGLICTIFEECVLLLDHVILYRPLLTFALFSFFLSLRVEFSPTQTFEAHHHSKSLARWMLLTRNQTGLRACPLEPKTMEVAKREGD